MSPIFTIRSTRPELVVRLRSEIQQLAWFSQGAGLLRGTDFGNVFSCALYQMSAMIQPISVQPRKGARLGRGPTRRDRRAPRPL